MNADILFVINVIRVVINRRYSLWRVGLGAETRSVRSRCDALAFVAMDVLGAAMQFHQ